MFNLIAGVIWHDKIAGWVGLGQVIKNKNTFFLCSEFTGIYSRTLACCCLFWLGWSSLELTVGFYFLVL